MSVYITQTRAVLGAASISEGPTSHKQVPASQSAKRQLMLLS